MRLILMTLILSSSVQGAAPLFQQAAAPGAWVRFQGTLTINTIEQPVNYLVRAGESVEKNGQKLMRLELIAHTENDGVERESVTFQLLIPEAAFGEGKDPVLRASETWVTYVGSEPRQIGSIAEVDPPFAMLLQGPTANTKTLHETHDVDWQCGRLACQVIEGESSYGIGPFALKATHRIYRHSDVPFGLAGVRQELSGKVGEIRESALLDVQAVDFGLKPRD